MTAQGSPAALPTLRRRLVQGVAWSVVAYGGAQLLRFASSLVLTRLLAPEYFGLMALVNVMLIGVNMFSDVGIGPNVVQSPRGTDRRFLDTAFTVQALRGVLIWLLCIVGAWPFARFYDDPRLLPLVAVAGAAAFIGGFNSTKMLTAQREIDMGRITLLELGGQAATVVFTIAYAAVFPSVWALVAASLFGALVKMVGSHLWLPGENNRFALDRTSLHELIRFGRWIFLSTIIAFTSNSAASLILGKFLPVAQVGIFSLAVTLANIVGQAYEQASSKLLFPLYAKLRHLPIDEMRRRVLKVRLVVSAAFLPPLVVLTLFGQQVIDLLLDPRYRAGGWILQLYAAFMIPTIVAASGPFYLAQGNALLAMVTSAVKLAFYLLCAAVGWHVGGANGIIVGMAAHSVFTYAFDLVIQWRYRILMPAFDIAAYAACALALAVGFHLRGVI